MDRTRTLELMHSLGNDTGDDYLAKWCAMDDPRTGGWGVEARRAATAAVSTEASWAVA
jgi:hypothetical protein